MLELEQLAEPRKSNLLALAGRRRPTALIPLGYRPEVGKICEQEVQQVAVEC